MSDGVDTLHRGLTDIIRQQHDRIETLETALREIQKHDGYSFSDRATLLLQISSIYKIARAALDPASQSSAGHSKDAGK